MIPRVNRRPRPTIPAASGPHFHTVCWEPSLQQSRWRIRELHRLRFRELEGLCRQTAAFPATVRTVDLHGCLSLVTDPPILGPVDMKLVAALQDGAPPAAAPV